MDEGDSHGSSQPYITSYRLQESNNLLKKLLRNILGLYLDLKTISLSSLYKKYATLLLPYVTYPQFFILGPFLDSSIARMADQRPKDKSSVSRGNGDSQMSGDVNDALLRYHSNKQEEISNDTLQLTRRLKAQSLAANAIIKQDIKKLDQIKLSTDAATAKLKMTSARLDDSLRNGWNCTFVILILAVFAIFVGMAVIIKYAKKA